MIRVSQKSHVKLIAANIFSLYECESITIVILILILPKHMCFIVYET